jgi:hypothetical protein
MAQKVLTDAFVSVNGVDLSDQVNSVTLTYEAEQKDDTMMGDGTRSNMPGLKNWSAEVTFGQNFDAAKVDATLFPLVGSSGFTLLIREVKSTAVGATNPNYSGGATLASYPPLSGKVGEFHEVTAKFVPAGSSPTLQRLTS